MTSMPMAGKPGRSGRKPSQTDKQLLRDLGQAHQNQPPRKVVRSWKKSVRGAVRKKKGGR